MCPETASEPSLCAGLYRPALRRKRSGNAPESDAYAPLFEFLDRDGLRKLGARADLCIHCATVEVEGLSIMEAMQQGAVPVIATGPITGADQFALDGRSLFQQHDARDLAGKIDWWLDHPEEREAMEQQYVAQMETYDIARSVQALVRMFQEACGAAGL